MIEQPITCDAMVTLTYPWSLGARLQDLGHVSQRESPVSEGSFGATRRDDLADTPWCIVGRYGRQGDFGAKPVALVGLGHRVEFRYLIVILTCIALNDRAMQLGVLVEEGGD
jgi:hypothetical protein